ncbi:hypothetical protein VTO42DRAFT_5319 [Malbranchea cinnamomea]
MMASSAIAERLVANPYGITEVYRSKNPLVDIVFVHGLNGSPFSTWATKDTNFFWPAELLPQTLHDQPIRVLMFGYNANVTAFMDGTSKDKLHNHAEQLAGHLYANRNLNNATERPIIFVCHSLGGLVVKKTLTYCSQLRHEKTQHLRSIFVSTYGILFLGTPHNGSDMAKWGSIIQSISHAVIPKKIFDSSEQLLNILKTDNEHLQNINRDFSHIMKRFSVYFFHESKPMDLKGTRVFVVDEKSAAPILDGVERMGIEADHGGMCRFRDENAPGYVAVAEAILRYSNDALKVIPSRWDEERTQRRLELDAERKRLSDLIDSAKASEISLLRNTGVSLENSTATLPPKQSEETLQTPIATSDVGQMPADQAEAEPLKPNKEPLFVLPPGFHPNSAFYGMQDELEELHTRLFKAKKRSQGSVAVLLYAGPGAGKSYLARQYMYQYQNLYPGGIFWVDSKTPQSRANGYWHIAQAASELKGEQQSPDPNWLYHDTYIDKVRRWLESREDWLLIFDGIAFDNDKEITEFKQYLPFRKNTSIIYTSVDRTLSKKSRLFEPYGLQVKPLAVSDAKKFLLKELGIKHPTPEQDSKATEIVKHYKCLPLAIHAISHRLVATGKPLEKYVIESQLIDQQLADPYQDIMRDLRLHGYIEALNLINILSFFSHHIPVGMVLLGQKALKAANIEIRSLHRIGSSERHLDNTLAILMKYGLIERTSDPDALSDQSSGSSIARTPSGLTQASRESETSQHSGVVLVNQARSSIDMIKVHTVVQGFCRDELKVQSPEDFYYWLHVATALFCKSYTEATARIKATRDPGHVRDYREYQTHARRLIRHFPTRPSRKAIDLRPSHKRLRELTEDIEKEIEQRSPGSSHESVRKQKSIFDTASSTSTEPSTPASDLSQTAWASDINTESPERTDFPPLVKSPPRSPPLRISTQPTDSQSQGQDLSPVSAACSLSPSQLTEVPTIFTDNNDEEGSQTFPEKPVRRKTNKFWEMLSNPFRKGRGRKDLGEFTPAASPVLTKVHGTGSSILQNESSERQSLTSLRSPSRAESMLANIGHSSPPSQGVSIRSPSRTGLAGHGRPTYASVIKGSQDEKSSEKRFSLPSSVRQIPKADLPFPEEAYRFFSDLGMEEHQDLMTQSAYSDPGSGLTDLRSPVIDLPVPYSRPHLRSQPSRGSNPHDGSDSYGPAAANFLPLPYTADIPITRRQPANISGTSNDAHNQGLGPPPRSSIPFPALSYGYGSEPLSRDPSHQSTQSLHTEPGRLPPRFSPDPMRIGRRLHKRTSSFTSIPAPGSPKLGLLFRAGRDSDVDSPVSFGSQAMSRASSGPGMLAGDGSVVEFGGVPISSSGDIRFGEQDPISVDEARRRTEQYENWLSLQRDGSSLGLRPRGRTPYPTHNLIPTSSDAEQSMLGRASANNKP